MELIFKRPLWVALRCLGSTMGSIVIIREQYGWHYEFKEAPGVVISLEVALIF